MKIKILKYDPTEIIVKSKIIEIPFLSLSEDNELMCKNFYIIEIGNKKIRIEKKW